MLKVLAKRLKEETSNLQKARGAAARSRVHCRIEQLQFLVAIARQRAVGK